MFDAANATPAEFRRSDAQEAPHRDLGATLEKIADDFGIHQITVSCRGQPGRTQLSSKRINVFAC